MIIEWDAAKCARNIAKHGVDFAAMADFAFRDGLVRADTRCDYGEVRMTCIAPIGGRLHVLVFTIERRALRVISLRKAGNKEIKNYENET